eukprot:31856_1
MDDSLEQVHSFHNTHWIFSLQSSYGIYYLLLATVGVVYFFSMCILTIHTLWCKENKVNSPIRIISTIHSISYMSSYGLCASMFVLSSHDHYSPMYYNAFYITHSIAFTFGHLSFYVFMLLRVYYSFVDKNFHESMYMVSVRMMYCHCAILLMDLTLFVCIWYFWYTTWYTAKYVVIFVVLSIMAGICLLFSILHFIYTFNSKLLLLTIHLDCDSSTRTGANELFNKKQLSLINAITKQSLLSCYSLCIIISLMLLGTILFILHKSINIPSKTETICAIFRCFLFVERFTEELSIYLSFVMNDKIYQILCKKCHQSFQNQCHLLAKKRIDEQKEIEKKESEKKEMAPLPAMSPHFQVRVKTKSNSSVLDDDQVPVPECDLRIGAASRLSFNEEEKVNAPDYQLVGDKRHSATLTPTLNTGDKRHSATSSTATATYTVTFTQHTMPSATTSTQSQ